MTSDARLTVAICTFNPDRRLLQRVVAVVAAQLAEADGELIVIDNASTPPLTQEDLGVLPAAAAGRCRIVPEPTPGLTAARKRAIRIAAGDILLFVDDDNVLSEDYIAKAAAAFDADERLGLLGGSVDGEYVVSPPEWVHEFEDRLAVRPHPATLYVETTGLPHTPYWPIGAGFAVRRALAEAYQDDCDTTTRIEGRRGEDLSAGEDVDLALFLVSRGYKLVLDGSLRLVHVIPEGRTTPTYLARCYVGGLNSTLALEEKWAPRFGERIFTNLYRPLSSTVPRLLLTAVLRFFSPRYAIKYPIYSSLARIRIATLLRSPLRPKHSNGVR